MERTRKEKSPVTDKGKSIFISHSTKDKKIVDDFVDLILHGALSVPIDEIFCVSTDGTKIKSGTDWRNSIKASLLSAKINFLIITPNYKESEVCLNEMGAAWITNAIVTPLIIDPIEYSTVGIIQEPSQIEKLLDEKSLDRIRDMVEVELKIPTGKIKSDRWTEKKIEFLIRIKKHLEKNPFEAPMDRPTFLKLMEKKADLENTITNLIEEKIERENYINDLIKAKDKSEVAQIIKQRNPSTQFQEFIDLCDVVKKGLKGYSSIFNGILFKSYSAIEFTIHWQGNERAIDEARSYGFINEDYDVLWQDTNEMELLKNALDDVDRFLVKDLDDNFFQSYEENFNARLDINNRLFWEEVFEATISFG